MRLIHPNPSFFSALLKTPPDHPTPLARETLPSSHPPSSTATRRRTLSLCPTTAVASACREGERKRDRGPRRHPRLLPSTAGSASPSSDSEREKRYEEIDGGRTLLIWGFLVMNIPGETNVHLPRVRIYFGLKTIGLDNWAQENYLSLGN